MIIIGTNNIVEFSIKPMQSIFRRSNQRSCVAKFIPQAIDRMCGTNRLNTSAGIIVTEVIALAINLHPTIIITIRSVVVLIAFLIDIPIALCQSTVIKFIGDLAIIDLSIVDSILSYTSFPVEQIPLFADTLPSSFDLTHKCKIGVSTFLEEATILRLTNIDTILAEVVIEAIDLLNASQSLAIDIVCEAAVFVDPAFLQDIDQGVLVGDLSIGVEEVAACIGGVGRITVGVNAEHSLAFGLLCEAVQTACTHIDLVADVTGGHGIDLGGILPDAILGSQLDAIDHAQGICGSHINDLALLDPAQSNGQGIGGFIKLLILQNEVIVEDLQLGVIDIETVIEVDGCLNPGQIADTLCQAGQEGPCIGAIHGAAGQHIGQLFQTLRNGQCGHIQRKDIGSDHILGRINNIVDVTVLDLGVGNLTVPCQHTVAAGSLIKVKAVLALLVQHDIDGCLGIFVEGCGDGHGLDRRLCSHEGKAVHGTCIGCTQSERHVICIDCDGLAFNTSTQGQNHAGAVDSIDLGLLEVHLIRVSDGHQLGADVLAIEHQIDINLTQTLSGEDAVLGDGCPSLITDCPGSTLGDIHSVAAGADAGSSHLHRSTDGGVIILALDHSVVKLGGAGSGGVDQQVGGNITGIAVGGTVHNGQVIAAGLAGNKGGGAAAVQVNCNNTASFLHDVANILQACTGGEGSLTAVDTHQNDTTSSSNTDRGTRSIALGCAADNLAIHNDKLAEATNSFLDLTFRHHGLVLIMLAHISGAISQNCKETCSAGLRMPLNAVHDHQATGSCNIGHIVTARVGRCDNIEVFNVVGALGIAVAVLSVLCRAGNGIVLPHRILGGTGIAVVVVDPHTHILTGNISSCHIVNNLLTIGIGSVVDLLGDTGGQDLGLGIEHGEAGVLQVFNIVASQIAHLIGEGVADCLTQLSQLVALGVKVTGTLQGCDHLVAGVSIVHSSTQILTGAQTIQTVRQQVADTLLQTQLFVVEILSHHLGQITGFIALGDQLIHEIVAVQVSVQVVGAEGTGRTCNALLEQIVLTDVVNLFIQGQVCRNTKLIGGAQQVSQVTDPAADIGVVLAALVVVGHIHGAEEVALQEGDAAILIDILLANGRKEGSELLQTGNIDPDIDIGISIDGVFCLLNKLQEVLILGACHNGPGTGGVVGNSGTHVVQHQAQGIGAGVLHCILLSHHFQIADVGDELLNSLDPLDLDHGNLDIALGVLATEFTGILLVLLQGLDGLTHHAVVMCSPADCRVGCLLGFSVHPLMLQSRDGICIVVTIQAVLSAVLVANGTAGCGDLHVIDDPVVVGHGNDSLFNQDLATDIAVRAFGQTGFGTGSLNSCVNDNLVLLLGIIGETAVCTRRAFALAGICAVPVVAQCGDDFLGDPELVTLLALHTGGHTIGSTSCGNLLSNGNTEMLLADKNQIRYATQRTGILHVRSGVTAVVLIGHALVPDMGLGISGQFLALGVVIAARAGHIGFVAGFLTGGSQSLVGHFVVAQRCNQLSAASVTGLCSLTGSLCTGSVAICRDNPAAALDFVLAYCIAVIVAAGSTIGVIGVTGLGTGGSLCFRNVQSTFVGTGQNRNLSVLALLCATDGALLVLDAGLQNGSFLVGDPCPLMAQSCIQLLAANGTGLCVLTVSLCASGVAQGCNQLLATNGTNLCILTVSLCTGSVAQSGLLHIGGVVAARAGLIGLVADIGTGGILCLVVDNVMTQCSDFLGLGSIATVTGNGLDTSCLTSCSGIDLRNEGTLCISMLTGPDTVDGLVGNLAQIVGGLHLGAVSVGQHSRGNGNLNPLFGLVFRTTVLDLIGLFIRLTGLHNDSASTTDIGAALGGVNITGRQVCSAVNFHIGILISADNLRCRSRILRIDIRSIASAAEGGAFVVGCILFSDPLIVVIDKDLVAAAKGNLRILANDQSCTGSQGDVLSHRHITAVHSNAHITIDGQNIVLRIDGLAAQ